ncbi:MAG: gamma-glutamyl-gamma-aminobutyrate hydrolase family protein [Candidatus Aquilonibacter sp.]|jgi:putative glutamine amidotransferase
MVRPTIGITSPLEWVDEEDLEQHEAGRHAKLLQSLGAATVIIPRGRATAEALGHLKLDGLLFSGGGDVDASLYGGRSELAADRVDGVRDAGELALLRRAFAQRVPMLCVCRGMQLANVAFGGTLIEDIPSLGDDFGIKHHQVRELGIPASEPTHQVVVQHRSMLASILGRSTTWTNSLHHQALRDLAAPISAVAHTADGIVEAVELTARDQFFMGVQWHPESLPDCHESKRLYFAFIQASGKDVEAL